MLISVLVISLRKEKKEKKPALHINRKTVA
jgi:hypothetical protein